MDLGRTSSILPQEGERAMMQQHPSRAMMGAGRGTAAQPTTEPERGPVLKTNSGTTGDAVVVNNEEAQCAGEELGPAGGACGDLAAKPDPAGGAYTVASTPSKPSCLCHTDLSALHAMTC